MNLLDYAKVLRARWLTVCVTALVVVLDALAFTLTTPPQYQASTQLFVSGSSGSSLYSQYQSSLLSEERLLSYSELITGRTLAQRTVDQLNLGLSAEALRAKVKATAQRGTVLINVSVLDGSPTRARDIVNALSDQFALMADEFDPPSNGSAQAGTRIVVAKRASVPTKPFTPNLRRNLLLALAAGVALGTGLAVVRDLLDNTVKSQETLEEITGSGVVGFIPFEKKFQAQPAISFDTDNSSAAEAFRKLRTNLQFLSVDNPPRVIVITSASPSEGKSTAAINIALALAEAEQNVVLVDGDLRRPRIAKYLGVVGSVGMSNALSGAAPLTEVLQTTKYPQLSVLAAGPTPPNPSELLGSRTAEKLFGELRTQFDYVIIDSAPLLAVTDGSVLAAHADGALIVVRAGKTKRDQLRHAIGMLNDVGATVLGGVLTMMPTRGSGVYSYNYYYYYGGGYGDDKRVSKPDQISETS